MIFEEINAVETPSWATLAAGVGTGLLIGAIVVACSS